MSTVSELYLRAVQYATSKGFSAKNDTCEWKLGDYRWMFNGKHEAVEGIPFGHLAVFNTGGWPVAILSPNGGTVIGDLEVEDKLIALLKKENPVEL